MKEENKPYPDAKLKFFFAEMPSASTVNGVYQVKLSLVIGVAAGAIEPILNSVTPPTGLNCLYDNIHRQPAVATNGELIGRVIYTYRLNCTSEKPINPNDLGNFILSYTYSK